MRILIISILLSMAFWGCSHHSDHRLLRLEQMASANDDSARIALDSLQALNPEQLSEDDRHLYDFLSVKIADKAYVRHRSDSLILSVISYEEEYPENGRYPEALYYGGRVYSDLGDFPTALQYFQQALDELPKDADPNLKGRILSQTGMLMEKLRLYKQAISCVKMSQKFNNNDAVGEVYDLQLLGFLYLHLNNYNAADSCFIVALGKSDNLPVSFRAKSSMYRAAVKYHTKQIDSARILIRNTPDLVKPIARNSALSYSARIYKSAGIFDSAYYYAHELINSNDFTNKKTGYKILLSPELSSFVSLDTARMYISEYRMALDQYLDENENQLALIQQARYNYNLHERERAKAENRIGILIYSIIGISFVTLILVVISLYLKNKNKGNIIQLHKVLSDLSRLQESIANNDAASQETAFVAVPEPAESAEDLRLQLRKKVLALYHSNRIQPSLSSDILRSDAYSRLQTLIANESELQDNDKLWNELEKTVLQSSPSFKKTLQLLAGSKLTTADIHTSILIKCDVTPTQMAILFNRTKGSISSRRESLCIKILGEKLGIKTIDGVIKLL